MDTQTDDVAFHKNNIKYTREQSIYIFFLMFGFRGIGCILTGLIRDKIKTSIPIMPILQITTLISTWIIDINLMYVCRALQGLFCTSLALTNTLLGEWVPDKRKIEITCILRLMNITGIILANYFQDFVKITI